MSTSMNKLVLLCFVLVSVTAMAADDKFEHVLPGQFHEILKNASAAYDRKDYKSAFEFNQRAACTGDKTSQAILGRMYVLGQGTEKDAVKGYAWIRLAADFNYPPFTSLAAKLEDAMTPQQRQRGNDIADSLRRKYGDAVTNISCHGESRRGAYVIDSVICSPEAQGGRLLLRRCVGAEAK